MTDTSDDTPIPDDEDSPEFRDVEPEDEWDDTDAFRVRLEILERIVDAIREQRDDRFRVRLAIALSLVGSMVDEHREDMDRLDRIKARLDELEDGD